MGVLIACVVLGHYVPVRHVLTCTVFLSLAAGVSACSRLRARRLRGAGAGAGSDVITWMMTLSLYSRRISLVT